MVGERKTDNKVSQLPENQGTNRRRRLSARRGYLNEKEASLFALGRVSSFAV